MAIGDQREMHAVNPLQSLNKRKACFVFIISSYNNNVDGSSTYGITGPSDHSSNTFAQGNDAISLNKYPVSCHMY